MRALKLDESYPIINLLFAVVILLIFAYAGFFHSEKGGYPIPSVYEQLTGAKANSSGLSRAFSEIVRFRLEKAKHHHEYSLQIFAFFPAQLLLRIFFLFVYPQVRNNQWLIRLDIILSVGLFLLCFQGLIGSIYS
jgi:hypothetical protein